jgi:undecaprenol kinase
MSSRKNNGFRSSFGNAFKGFNSALITERNLKIHFVAGILAILAGLILHISLLEWCLILLVITNVIVAELFNTAVECTVDLAHPEHHDLARKAKDISASAVLVTALCSALVGVFIFLPKIIALFSN